MISESDICTFVREVISILCPVPFKHQRVHEARESHARPIFYRLYFMSRDLLTTEDVVPTFSLLLIKQNMAEIREMWIINMMEPVCRVFQRRERLAADRQPGDPLINSKTEQPVQGSCKKAEDKIRGSEAISNHPV